MKKNEAAVLEKLQEIQEAIEGTLRQNNNFTVKTMGAEGISYTHDRENYLHLGMEIASDQLQELIEEIQERAEQKSKFTLLGKK